MRKIEKEKYMIAATLTVIVFSLGLLLGLVINQEKIEYMEKLTKEQEVEFSSLQFQYLYLDRIHNNESCQAISKTLENNLKILAPILEELERQEELGNLDDPNYITLKRKYILANLRYWLLAQMSKESCDNDIVTMFYFYTPDCKDCKDIQGITLTHLKKIFEDKLLIYPIDASFDKEPMTDILNRQYNITQYPTLVIENTPHEGLMSKEEILTEICPLYTEKLPECEPYITK